MNLNARYMDTKMLGKFTRNHSFKSSVILLLLAFFSFEINAQYDDLYYDPSYDGYYGGYDNDGY